ncbi:hypothetical protein ACPYIV_16280 [Parabacteroides sp. ASD2025]|jgi:hypothetical protein|uniref:hypothetical protein n=1 Tax=Parabacteroides sp. ASD2025 TaxID=3415987 RepID=UPI0025D1EC81|nr:hypothetical protein [uncultured Parabacteroides sp.]
MRHILFICLLLFCMACEENKSIDPTIMPEATETGANTFGCLVDGWVYASGRWGLPNAEYMVLEDSTGMTVSAQVDFGTYLRFTIANPKQGKTLPYKDASFDNQKIEDGKVYISRMSDGVFSGTFEGGRVTKGRFDLKYKE